MQFLSTKLSCWSLCKSTENCNWFSYSATPVDHCRLYETCPEIDETLQWYISGQKECQYDYGEKY